MVNFVVEDGSGDPDSNSYVDVDFADDYISTNPYASDAWLAKDDTAKQGLLIRSSKYLDRTVDWDGYRVASDSGLRWPRSNVYDSDGFEIGDDTIPPQLKEAVCELAAYLLSSDWTNLEGSRGIKEVKADVVDVKFDITQIRGSLPFSVTALVGSLGSVKSGNRPGFKKIIRS